MTIYFLAAEADADGLNAAVETNFSSQCKKVAAGQWMVVANLTPKDVIQKIDGGEGKFGRIVAFEIGSYWGWHSRDLWDWLDLKKKAAE